MHPPEHDVHLVQTLLRQLHDVSAVVGVRTRGVLGEFGLTETSAGVLWMLDPAGPPASMRELARRIGCDPSTVTLVADKLEHAGLTVRRSNPADGRARLLTLTDAGLAMRERLHERLVRDTPLARLTREEQLQLAALLTRLGGETAADLRDGHRSTTASEQADASAGGR